MAGPSSGERPEHHENGKFSRQDASSTPAIGGLAGAISSGFAELRRGETAGELIARADFEFRDSRRD